MPKRKLKKYVKPTLFMISISIIVISLISITRTLKPSNGKNDDYVMNPIIENTTPVVSTIEQPEEEKIVKPFTSEKVVKNISFYEKEDTEENQQNALIYYENTYLQNSGIVYTSEEEFDCVAVLDGTVIDIKQDEILNTIVYVSHNSNLTTIYYGLKDVNVKVNDTINQNDVIGKSANNRFCNEDNSMMFEVNYNGQILNPEKFYSMSINDLN